MSVYESVCELLNKMTVEVDVSLADSFIPTEVKLEDQGHVMKNVHFSAMDAVSCLQNKSDVLRNHVLDMVQIHP